MKLVSYHENGSLRPGVLIDDAVVDVAALVERRAPANGLSYGSVKEIISTAGRADLVALDGAAREAVAQLGKPISGVRLGPPVPDPQKICCVGLNYDDNVAAARAANQPTGTGDPVVSMKFPTSLIGHGAAIELLKVAPDQVDCEGTLAVVIGRNCRRVSRRDALEHVAGYTVMNDVNARDLQAATAQWTIGKGFDTSGPCGPALVTADEIANPHALELTTVLNGEVVQSASTSQMIHSVASLIAVISSVITLLPGDIITTGTPGGVGSMRNPQVFLKEGDTVTVSISGLGELTNPVRNEH